MRITFAIVLMAGMYTVVAQGATSRRPQESPDRTVRDGIYTETQAKRGETMYTRACAGCHGPDLMGDGQASSLVGKDFNVEWADLSMNDLSERIRVSMPADAPGTLEPADVADLMAFMLSKGDFPTGQTELPADPAALKQVKFIAPKP
jgi:S-disulfanyl-L-cysteine oxidoreductase SoxD